jgi:hypothetical protein
MNGSGHADRKNPDRKHGGQSKSGAKHPGLQLHHYLKF